MNNHQPDAARDFAAPVLEQLTSLGIRLCDVMRDPNGMAQALYLCDHNDDQQVYDHAEVLALIASADHVDSVAHADRLRSESLRVLVQLLNKPGSPTRTRQRAYNRYARRYNAWYLLEHPGHEGPAPTVPLVSREKRTGFVA